MTFGELAARFIASGAVRPHHLYHLKFLLPFFSEASVLRMTKSSAEEFRSARKTAESIHQGRNYQPGLERAAAHFLLGRG